MKPKKTDQANVEKWRPTYLLLGLAVALAFTIMGFEWQKKEWSTATFTNTMNYGEEEDMADITKQEEVKPPAPQDPVIHEVEDDTEIEDDQSLLDFEFDEEQAIEPAPIIEEVEEVKEEEIFMIVEDMPEFPGGEEALFQYLRDNVEYPEMEREDRNSGLVVVFFVVEPDGNITNVKIEGGRGNTPNMNKEAVRVVQSMPEWKPGKQRNKPVRVSIKLPIRFQLAG